MDRRYFINTLGAVGSLALVDGLAQKLYGAEPEPSNAEKSGILPYLQNPAPDGMTICFLSLNASDVKVLWSKGTASPSTSVNATSLKIPKTTWTIWKARIKNLSPGTKYSYKVSYKEGGVDKTSAIYTFTTFNPKSPEVNAVVFNDVHDRIPVLEALLKQIKPSDYDFSILLGDMWNDPNPSKNATRVFETMEAYVRLLDASNKPMLYMRGNHDTRGGFAGELSYLFDLPNNDPTAKFADQDAYYDFRTGPVWFIAPDAGEDGDKRQEMFQRYRERQVGWLQKIFAESPDRNAPWRVVAIHIPLYNSSWWDQPDALKRWEPSLNKANIDVMIAGHDHAWRNLEKGKTYTRKRKTKEGEQIEDKVTPPYPVLIGGGPNLKGGEVGTVMVIKADAKRLKIDLVNTEGKTLSKVDLKK
ncbi:MAG: metallophosphoesterase [Puniceicoccales bacterium]|jgi:predicted phosphodiesterase|nr:metallophosphoesterase [Puniceicoccales bacterium]